MKNNWKIEDGILDALVDDDESIVQIEEYLSYLGVPFSKNEVKQLLIKMMSEELVEIQFPKNMNVEDLIVTDSKSIKKLWFSITNKGHQKWDEIKL